MAAPALAGTATPADAPPNLLHVQFKNPEFLTYLSQLQAQGLVAPDAGNAGKPAKSDPAHPLSEHNVMAYFATSPFFDRRSNNEQIRMQNIANGIQNLTGGMGARQEEQELKRFTGLEFVLVHARPPLCFVIQKRWRTSPTETTPLAAYYIVNDSIYQAPDMYSVLATRLQSTVYGLQSSLSAQRRARPSFDPRRGHHGRFIIPDPPTSSANPASGTARNHGTKTSPAASEQSDDDGAELDDVELPPATSGPEPAPQKRARFD
ncbi:MED6-domain-containing protein [Moesziomyces antarcticus]|uniref:Mediator of RNA polymerase II transcription subunit 6 n=1 Tax=Pseudozyma antarctica TaxID=84753 RepID=A0A5C3FE33_PSEA2|nr:MED6-domain-containing protein [Moesziomyces antarcticus]GAK62149.1 MED6-domain-containing protein [Moesziomyces antarcticus]SPO42683.1 probable Mediator of RNA polymerase II transcription subunit 6 [Moesziomyces antarcticus]